MEIINFHAHIYPPKIAKRAVDAVGDFYLLEMAGDGTAEGLIEESAKCGVTRNIVHSVATMPNQVQSINNFIADQCIKYKQLTGFCTLHQDMENVEEEIQRITALGLKGVKIHPDTQRFNADSKEMFKIYDIIRGKLPLLIHCGDYRYEYSHPFRIKNILNNFPDLTLIGAHFGGWSLWDLALEYLKDTKCYVDTASSFKFLGNIRSKQLIKEYGSERVLFGTDFPMWDTNKELELITSFGLSNEELENIFYKNAYKILNQKM